GNASSGLGRCRIIIKSAIDMASMAAPRATLEISHLRQCLGRASLANSIRSLLVGQLHLNFKRGVRMERSNVWLATSLINARVRNSAGENLGRIEDVAIDPETGTVAYAILSFGGMMGVGTKLFPIPWSSVNMSASGDYVVFDASKDSLQNAPA